MPVLSQLSFHATQTNKKTKDTKDIIIPGTVSTEERSPTVSQQVSETTKTAPRKSPRTVQNKERQGKATNIMSSSSSSSSSLRPFVAGAVAALSLVYISKKAKWFLEPRQSKKTSPSPPRQPPSPSSSSTPQEDNEDTPLIMDSPDLDQRLIRKAEGAIQKRTSRLTVVVERCTNDFNYSAILRTVEALGIQHVWIVDPPVQETVVEHDHHTSTKALKRSTGQVIKAAAPEEIEQRQTHHLFAQRAAEWLSVREFETTTQCIDELRSTGHTIWATDLSQEAVCLTREALGGSSTTGTSEHQPQLPLLPAKLAIVFGTEAVGCTHEMLSSADQRVYLPLYGFADSLNLSVATALVVQQLFHLDPTLLGAMSEEERTGLRQQWFSKLATQRLLSSKDKKRQKRLSVQLQICEKIKDQQASGKSLQPEQLAKLKDYDDLKKEAHDLETFLTQKAQTAVRELVRNPPAPLSDMRRADEHRACYVGKKTKSRQGGQWDNMPATTGYNTTAHSQTNSSSDYFRGLAGIESHNEHGAAATAPHHKDSQYSSDVES